MSDEPRRRRFPRLIVIATVLLVMLAAVVSWNLRMPANDPQVQAIRQQGYPVTLAEWDAWYTKVPDAENLALVYTNAFARIATASNDFQGIKNETWIPKRG